MSFKEILIEEASMKFLHSCIDRIKEIFNLYEILDTQKNNNKENFDMLNKRIHDLKNDSGSYEIVFIANACCNLIDFNNENKDKILAGHFHFDFPNQIVDLMKSFVTELIQEYKQKEQKVYHKALDDVSTSEREGRHRVLVVERDDILISHYQNFYKKLNISCAVVSSGIEAFNRLLNEKFDSLVTSVHVGVIDGLSLIALSKVVNSPNIGIKTILIAKGELSVLPLHSMPFRLVVRDENLFLNLESIFESLTLVNNESLELQNVHGNIRIMALDDDEEVHTLLKLGLDSKNVKLNCTKNSTEFYKELDTFRPNLILLDVGLEKESGVNVLKELRKNPLYYSIPVMFITARDQDDEGQNLENTDAIGIISKPFSPKTILNEILELYELYYPSLEKDIA
jgi:DNA-binding response OmpR family regulator